MSMGNLAALVTAVAALVTAVTGLVKVLLERQAKQANRDTAVPPDMPVRRYPAPWLVAAVGLGLLAVGVWVGPPLYRYVTSSNVTVQPPFESAKLYDFARYLFDPGDCKEPVRASEAPVAFPLPHSELVKCDSRPDQPYTGTFLCTNNVQDFDYNRTEFLSYAIDGIERQVTRPPAGKDEPVDGVQVAYNHVNSHDARVYWDSPSLLCAGELQAVRGWCERSSGSGGVGQAVIPVVSEQVGDRQILLQSAAKLVPGMGSVTGERRSEAPLVTVAVMDISGRLLPAGERGEIVVRSSLVMAGYSKNPAATEEASSFGWHHTGDIGYLDADNYLYVEDRAKDMIITGGFNVYSAEVEQVLMRPAVRDCAVIGLPDEKCGERITAVVLIQAEQTVALDDLKEFVKERIGSIKTPHRSRSGRICRAPRSARS
jgi:hypothetical protein